MKTATVPARTKKAKAKEGPKTFLDKINMNRLLDQKQIKLIEKMLAKKSAWKPNTGPIMTEAEIRSLYAKVQALENYYRPSQDNPKNYEFKRQRQMYLEGAAVVLETVLKDNDFLGMFDNDFVQLELSPAKAKENIKHKLKVINEILKKAGVLN